MSQVLLLPCPQVISEVYLFPRAWSDTFSCFVLHSISVITSPLVQCAGVSGVSAWGAAQHTLFFSPRAAVQHRLVPSYLHHGPLSLFLPLEYSLRDLYP